MQDEVPNHYATLGLHSSCTADEIRKAYRILAKAHHPDVNQNDPDASEKTHAITDAYKVLSNAVFRKAYDEELEKARRLADQQLQRATIVDIKEDVYVSVQDLIRGTSLEVTVNDPANPNGTETYELNVTEETAPGTRFRIKREPPFDNGYVIARVKVRPDMRFKAKGSDLKCDLHINHRLAMTGGSSSVNGPTGNYLHVEIPEHCPRGEIIRIEGEGLPQVRGGRGDLLVRVMYRPEVRVSKSRMRESGPSRRRLR